MVLPLVLLPVASADTFWDIPADRAAALASALKPGDTLLRWCAGCGDDVVIYRIGRDRVVAGTYSEDQQVQVTWRSLAMGPGTDGPAVFGGEPACVEAPICLADPVDGCADRWAYVDVPYTWRLDAGGKWVWVGALIGLEAQSTYEMQPIAPDPAWVAAALRCAPVKGRRPVEGE